MFLEDQLGAILFKKGGRKLAVTDIGHALYEHCERIAAEIEEAGLGTTRMQTELRGMLRVSMPCGLLAPVGLAAAIARVRGQLSRHPSGDRCEQPLDRCSRSKPYDVAVQLGTLPETHGGIRHLASISRGVYASPSFLEKKGVPVSVTISNISIAS